MNNTYDVEEVVGAIAIFACLIVVVFMCFEHMKNTDKVVNAYAIYLEERQ